MRQQAKSGISFLLTRPRGPTIPWPLVLGSITCHRLKHDPQLEFEPGLGWHCKTLDYDALVAIWPLYLNMDSDGSRDQGLVYGLQC